MKRKTQSYALRLYVTKKNWARKSGETDTNLGNVEKGIGLVWFHDCYIHPFNILYPWNIWGGKKNPGVAVVAAVVAVVAAVVAAKWCLLWQWGM